MDAFMLEYDTNIRNANTVKKSVLRTLLENDEISQEVHDEYEYKWQMLIFKNSWFESWFKKFSKNKGNPNDYSYKFIKIE